MSDAPAIDPKAAAEAWLRRWLEAPRCTDAGTLVMAPEAVEAVIASDPRCAADLVFRPACGGCRAVLLEARLRAIGAPEMGDLGASEATPAR